MPTLHPQIFTTIKPVIGMLHLLPLPGSPRYGGDAASIRDGALRDADALIEGGVHGLMLENFGDVPFYPDRVPASVVAFLSVIAAEVRRKFPVPLGINLLRNDGRSAMAVAAAVGADFIRVNVLTGARVADQGLLQGIAHDLLRDRVMLDAARVRIFADVDVKHSAPLAVRPLVDDVEDTLARGMADALVVSGAGTGKPTDVAKVRAVKAAAGVAPVFVGSGVTVQTVESLLSAADGLIVGTAFKPGGNASMPVDRQLVADLMHAVAKGAG
jgi:membrane complex biogenesis BtpA family protein